MERRKNRTRSRIIGTMILIVFSIINSSFLSNGTSLLRAIGLDYCLLSDRHIYIEKEVQRDKGSETKDNMESDINKNKTDNSDLVGSDNYVGGDKIAYLTFDDGPSKTTPQILDILNEHNIKATFFTIGKNMENNPDLVKRLIREGHSLGNHSYSHDYKIIYGGLGGFEREVRAWERTAKDILGEDYNVSVFRFPGGSHTKEDKFKEHIGNMGYNHYDWNALNGDSEKKEVSEAYLLDRTKETVRGQEELIFLMHDAMGKEATVKTLPKIIKYLQSEGYEFKTLE